MRAGDAELLRAANEYNLALERRDVALAECDRVESEQRATVDAAHRALHAALAEIGRTEKVLREAARSITEPLVFHEDGSGWVASSELRIEEGDYGKPLKFIPWEPSEALGIRGDEPVIDELTPRRAGLQPYLFVWAVGLVVWALILIAWLITLVAS